MNTILKCIIIDDERGAHSILKNYIGRLNNIVLVDSFYDAVGAYQFLKRSPVDLILLDINIPELDGFGLMDILDAKPAVIFTTAYTEYALKSYDYHAVDYLHKPIRFERFVTAIAKAELRLKSGNRVKPVTEIAFKIDGQMKEIQLNELVYVESQGNYVILHTLVKKHLVLMTMQDIEILLPKDLFIRIHKSFLVNTRCIEKSGSDQIILLGTSVPVGKTYKKYVAAFLSDAKY